MDFASTIVTTPGVRGGKPCFIGTRITVDDVLGYLASGMTVEQIVEDFPELTDELVHLAIEFESVRESRTSSTS